MKRNDARERESKRAREEKESQRRGLGAGWPNDRDSRGAQNAQTHAVKWPDGWWTRRGSTKVAFFAPLKALLLNDHGKKVLLRRRRKHRAPISLALSFPLVFSPSPSLSPVLFSLLIPYTTRLHVVPVRSYPFASESKRAEETREEKERG